MNIQKRTPGEAIQETVVVATIAIVISYIALVMAGAIYNLVTSF